MKSPAAASNGAGYETGGDGNHQHGLFIYIAIPAANVKEKDDGKEQKDVGGDN